MHYAEKELREAMAYLEQARATHEAIKALSRALELGQPVEVSFRTAGATVTTLCPAKGGEKLLLKLEQQAWERVVNLEKQEVYWCQEVAHLDRQRQINEELRTHPEKTFQQVRDELNRPPYTVAPTADA